MHIRSALGGLLAALTLVGCGGPEPAATTDAATAPAAPGGAWFTEITEPAGLAFQHGAGSREDRLSPEIMGSGGALFDYDHDGDLDVYVVDAGGENGDGAPNRMFRQEADGTFTDVTGASALGDPGYGMGTALGDVDNDGDLDLFVANFGPDALYLDGGDGRFENATAAAGVADPRWSTSACFLDYDGDGALDLYVATYLDFDPPKACSDSAGNPEFCGPEAFRGVPDRLYRGRGDGTFEDVSAAVLVGQPANKGLGVVCADLDGDALVDVYVANDGEENQLWINRGDGRFEDEALIQGAALNAFGRSEASMGVAAGDVDGDLDLDLFMTHLDRETNTLYLNLGDVGFEDGTATSGLGPSGLQYTGFGTALFDADLDGDLDLALVNGRVRRGASPSERAARREAWRVEDGVPAALHDYAEPNLFFLNDGSGRFEDASALGGRLTATVEVARGLVAGDLDRDGDLDLLVTSCGGQARLLRNDAPRRGHWLRVRAVDSRFERDALGAVVQVRAGGRTLARPVVSAQGYLSAVEPEVHFGLGDAERVEAITVVWPDGTEEAFAGVDADRAVELRRGSGETS